MADKQNLYPLPEYYEFRGMPWFYLILKTHRQDIKSPQGSNQEKSQVNDGLGSEEIRE